MPTISSIKMPSTERPRTFAESPIGTLGIGITSGNVYIRTPDNATLIHKSDKSSGFDSVGAHGQFLFSSIELLPVGSEITLKVA